MKFFCIFQKGILYMAIEKGNIEIIKLLLSCKNIDVNMKTIQKLIFVIHLILSYFQLI